MTNMEGSLSWEDSLMTIGQNAPRPRGQRKYACDKKGRGTRKKGDFGDYIGRGK